MLALIIEAKRPVYGGGAARKTSPIESIPGPGKDNRSRHVQCQAVQQPG
jgi:hypothetical protein